MHIFNPSPVNRTNTPIQALDIIDSKGCLKDYNDQSFKHVNVVEDLERLASMDLDTGDYPIAVFRTESLKDINVRYGLPNLYDAFTAATYYDKDQDEAYIIIPDDLLNHQQLLEAAIVHEAVHVEQIRRGDFVIDVCGGKVSWKGTEHDLLTLHKRINCRYECYLTEYPEEDEELLLMLAEMEKPWELEAYVTMLEYCNLYDRLPAFAKKIIVDLRSDN